MDGNWLDAMVQEATSLVALPGILGCQLWRQNLEGIFHPEINEGELRVAIEQIITSASAPRLDSRARTGTGMVPLAMLTGEITLSNSYTIDPRTAPWHELLSPLGVRSIVAIPMTNQGSPSGVLVLHGAYPNQFSSKWSTSFSIELRQRLAQILRSYGENPVRVSTGNGEEYRKLLYSGSLTMYGQPIVELTSGDTVKVEMLARMIRSDGSIATPASFMSSFNEADLDTLFLQGLDHSLRQLQAWDRQGLVVSVSLNIAPSTVLNPQSNVWIRQSLETYGIDPQRLTLELIENQEITSEFHSEAVRSLSKIGVLLAIDDLGSGYSSLKRLASLPFDIIKIDQSIVRAFEYDPISNLSLIRTIIQIGADFDRYVIVEGVETEAEI
jgi:EAL domain-containing protein (putative c-di-GMP-specific phosphodiesterase class I)